MDENDIRNLLDRMANAAAPPSAVSAAAAARRGLRRLWLRRAGLPGAAVGATATVAALVAVGIVPFGHGQGQPTRRTVAPATAGRSHHHAAIAEHDVLSTSPAHAQSVFDVTRPYVSFGWLPARYAPYVGGDSYVGVLREGRMALSNQWAAGAINQAAGVEIDLYANSAQGCRIASHPVSFACPGYPALPLVTAPPVAGKPAFWEAEGQLLWQYAPGAFATIGAHVLHGNSYDPAGSLQTPGSPGHGIAALLVQVASRALFGYHGHIPFGFQYQGPVPSGWLADEAGFTSPVPGAGPVSILGESLTLGPGRGTYSPLTIDVTPNASLRPIDRGCYWDRTLSRHVLIGGVDWIVSTTRNAFLKPVKGSQELCVVEHGLKVLVGLDLRQPVAGASSLGGIVNVGRHLQIFTTDPATWTTDPIR
jgi:hypothetical protein